MGRFYYGSEWKRNETDVRLWCIRSSNNSHELRPSIDRSGLLCELRRLQWHATQRTSWVPIYFPYYSINRVSLSLITFSAFQTYSTHLSQKSPTFPRLCLFQWGTVKITKLQSIGTRSKLCYCFLYSLVIKQKRAPEWRKSRACAPAANKRTRRNYVHLSRTQLLGCFACSVMGEYSDCGSGLRNFKPCWNKTMSDLNEKIIA